MKGTSPCARVGRVTTTLRLFVLVGVFTATTAAGAGEALVAVASNFNSTLGVLANDFRRSSGHVIHRSPGSSGKLYAQIVNGAPYDVFLSADTQRPQRLLASGHAVAGSGFDYAAGALVLWSTRPGYDDCLQRLRAMRFDHLALANPALAPYGVAAQDWLRREGLLGQVSDRLVVGENIGQAFHFVASGNAGLGLIAAAQLRGDFRHKTACAYPIGADAHLPILQRAVLLEHGRDNTAAQAFLEFLGSEEAVQVILASGYHRP